MDVNLQKLNYLLRCFAFGCPLHSWGKTDDYFTRW